MGALVGAGGAWAATTGRGLVDLTKPTSPFEHMWQRTVGGDWARQALRRDYQDQLLDAHRDLGIEALRFHGILSTEMSTYAPTAGPLRRPAPFTRDEYSFFNVDQVYDFLVEHGMRPFVELSDMPDALAANRPAFRTFLYGFNSAVPADYAGWGRLVAAFAQHLVDRYGIREVRTWPFEVWNEPNLPVSTGEDRRQFAAVKRHREASLTPPGLVTRKRSPGRHVGGEPTTGAAPTRAVDIGSHRAAAHEGRRASAQIDQLRSWQGAQTILS